MFGPLLKVSLTLGNRFCNMTDRKQTGERGETLAVAHLIEAGYRIETTNYRYRRAEIDIVARLEDLLVFVEVKTRSSLAYGHPSRFLKPAQQRRISNAASAYTEETGHEWAIRFDCISIFLHPNGHYRLEHIEDAFFPGLH